MALSVKEIRAHRDASRVALAKLWKESYDRIDAEHRELVGVTSPCSLVPKKFSQNDERYTACYGTGKCAQKARRRDRFYAEFPNCHYCEVQLTRENRSVDHVIPKSRGGSNRADNLVASCKKCNHKKGSNILDADGKVVPQAEQPKVGKPKRKKFALWDWCEK